MVMRNITYKKRKVRRYSRKLHKKMLHKNTFKRNLKNGGATNNPLLAGMEDDKGSSVPLFIPSEPFSVNGSKGLQKSSQAEAMEDAKGSSGPSFIPSEPFSVNGAQANDEHEQGEEDDSSSDEEYGAEEKDDDDAEEEKEKKETQQHRERVVRQQREQVVVSDNTSGNNQSLVSKKRSERKGLNPDTVTAFVKFRDVGARLFLRVSLIQTIPGEPGEPDKSVIRLQKEYSEVEPTLESIATLALTAYKDPYFSGLGTHKSAITRAIFSAKTILDGWNSIILILAIIDGELVCYRIGTVDGITTLIRETVLPNSPAKLVIVRIDNGDYETGVTALCCQIGEVSEGRYSTSMLSLFFALVSHHLKKLPEFISKKATRFVNLLLSYGKKDTITNEELSELIRICPFDVTVTVTGNSTNDCIITVQTRRTLRDTPLYKASITLNRYTQLPSIYKSAFDFAKVFLKKKFKRKEMMDLYRDKAISEYEKADKKILQKLMDRGETIAGKSPNELIGMIVGELMGVGDSSVQVTIGHIHMFRGFLLIRCCGAEANHAFINVGLTEQHASIPEQGHDFSGERVPPECRAIAAEVIRKSRYNTILDGQCLFNLVLSGETTVMVCRLAIVGLPSIPGTSSAYVEDIQHWPAIMEGEVLLNIFNLLWSNIFIRYSPITATVKDTGGGLGPDNQGINLAMTRGQKFWCARPGSHYYPSITSRNIEGVNGFSVEIQIFACTKNKEERAIVIQQHPMPKLLTRQSHQSVWIETKDLCIHTIKEPLEEEDLLLLLRIHTLDFSRLITNPDGLFRLQDETVQIGALPDIANDYRIPLCLQWLLHEFIAYIVETPRKGLKQKTLMAHYLEFSKSRITEFNVHGNKRTDILNALLTEITSRRHLPPFMIQVSTIMSALQLEAHPSLESPAPRSTGLSAEHKNVEFENLPPSRRNLYNRAKEERAEQRSAEAKALRDKKRSATATNNSTSSNVAPVVQAADTAKNSKRSKVQKVKKSK